MTARHPLVGRTALVEGMAYTIAAIDGPTVYLYRPGVALVLTATPGAPISLPLAPEAPTEAPPTAPALPTEPGPLSATLLARLGVADRAELPARELAALHLGHPPTDAEIRAVLAETGTTKQAPAATLDTPGGPLTIARTYKGNRVWLTIIRKK